MYYLVDEGFTRPKSNFIPPPCEAKFRQSTSWPSSHTYILILQTSFAGISKFAFVSPALVTLIKSVSAVNAPSAVCLAKYPFWPGVSVVPDQLYISLIPVAVCEPPKSIVSVADVAAFVNAYVGRVYHHQQSF